LQGRQRSEHFQSKALRLKTRQLFLGHEQDGERLSGGAAVLQHVAAASGDPAMADFAGVRLDGPMPSHRKQARARTRRY
jgi:hypothetical protein